MNEFCKPMMEVKSTELPAQTKDNTVHRHRLDWRSGLVNRLKSKIEVVALCAVLGLAWGVLSLPVIFYHLRTTEITVSYILCICSQRHIQHS